MSIAETWGTTCQERQRSYPCDNLLECTDLTLYRGITIDAPAPAVFRWLCQLRAAPYSYDVLDNLGRRSPQHLTPGLDDLAPGQRVMTIFDLASFERDAQITIRTRPGRPRTLFGDVAVTYVVTPIDRQSSRLLGKLCVRTPRGPVGRVVRYFLPWGDLVMMRKQFLNLKRLAEATR